MDLKRLEYLNGEIFEESDLQDLRKQIEEINEIFPDEDENN